MIAAFFRALAGQDPAVFTAHALGLISSALTIVAGAEPHDIRSAGTMSLLMGR